MSDIRDRLIRFAYEHPDKREVLLPLINKLSGGDHAPSYMSVSNLQKLAVQSLKLLKMVDQHTHFDDWVEAHVTEAAAKMDSVYEHLMYPNEGPTAKEAKSFEDAIKDKKFKNPETGNDVKFESLPADEQKKVRKEWKEKNKDEDKGKSDKKDKGKDKYKNLLEEEGSEPVDLFNTESKKVVENYEAIGESEIKKYDKDNNISRAVGQLRKNQSPKVEDAVGGVKALDKMIDDGKDYMVEDDLNDLKEMKKSLETALDRIA